MHTTINTQKRVAMNCVHCGKQILNKGSLAAHEKSCHSNPERIQHKRGEGAGRRKGQTSPTKGRKMGRAAHWDDKFPISEVFVENSTYPRHCLKKRVLSDELLKYECSCCGQLPVWFGKPLVLILDHINGVNNDNRIENLRFVCSNCDSQLPTYKSKNRK